MGLHIRAVDTGYQNLRIPEGDLFVIGNAQFGDNPAFGVQVFGLSDLKSGFYKMGGSAFGKPREEWKGARLEIHQGVIAPYVEARSGMLIDGEPFETCVNDCAIRVLGLQQAKYGILGETKLSYLGLDIYVRALTPPQDEPVQPQTIFGAVQGLTSVLNNLNPEDVR